MKLLGTGAGAGVVVLVLVLVLVLMLVLVLVLVLVPVTVIVIVIVIAGMVVAVIMALCAGVRGFAHVPVDARGIRRATTYATHHCTSRSSKRNSSPACICN